MPRAGQVKPDRDQRLTDHVALGVLTATFPPGLIDEVLAATGRVEQRSRLLPARLVVYYVLALALFSGDSYEEVMRCLVEGLSWASGWAQAWDVPTKGAIAKARERLTAAPLVELFARGCRPLATPATPGAFYRGLRLTSIDGTVLDVADTPANDAEFGRPSSGRGDGKGAFPQVRVVGLGECGTHAVTAVAVGACTTGEQALARKLLSALGPGMLCLADRNFTGYPLFAAAAANSAQLLWRAKTGLRLPVLERYPDGSYRSELVAATDRRRAHPLTVRVIEYTIDDPGRPQAEQGHYRLVTTLLDPDQAPAGELGALYAQRWEFENLLDELKTHQRGPRVVLRSKTPAGVTQEVYGHLCTHYAIRALMHTAAAQDGTDSDRLSFTRALKAARRSVRAGLGTAIAVLSKALEEAKAEICRHLLPPRRLRAAPRVVKRKMSNYGVKRAEHHTWPQPTRNPNEAIHILAPP